MKKILFVLFCLPIIGFSQTYKNSIYNEDEVEWDEAGIAKDSLTGTVLTGTVKSTYSGGEHSLREYKNGKLNGFWIEYYKNNQIHFIKSFENGFQKGPYYEYYPNGQLSTVSCHNANKQGTKGFFCDGNWTTWNEDGKITGIWFYKNGRMQSSTSFMYNKLGALIHENKWSYNKTIKGYAKQWSYEYNEFDDNNYYFYSEWEYRKKKESLPTLEREYLGNNENGILLSEKKYSDGKLISQKCFDEDGNKIECH